MLRTSRYDVAVVGAGPAGSRTARLLAERGYQVVLLERDPQVGRPVHCTGIVSRECLERYNLPTSLVLHSANSFVLHSPKGRRAGVKRRMVQAYILDRVALDQHLAAEAQSAGVDLLTGMNVRSVVWRGDGVELTASAAHGPARVTARVAVVATGFGAPLARAAGFDRVREVISGCQAVVTARAVDRVEVFTGSSVGHGGYGWLVPWRPGLALAGVLTRKHAVHYMADHIRRLQEGGWIGEAHRTFRCRPIPLRMPERSVADGILGVGDVVSQVKPTTGGGIYFAILGADVADQAIHEALTHGDVSESALRSYEARWRELMGPEIRRGYLLRRICEQLPEGIVEHLHRLLRNPVLRRMITAAAPSFDWHSGPLSTVLERFQRQVEPGVGRLI